MGLFGCDYKTFFSDYVKVFYILIFIFYYDVHFCFVFKLLLLVITFNLDSHPVNHSWAQFSYFILLRTDRLVWGHMYIYVCEIKIKFKKNCMLIELAYCCN